MKKILFLFFITMISCTVNTNTGNKKEDSAKEITTLSFQGIAINDSIASIEKLNINNDDITFRNDTLEKCKNERMLFSYYSSIIINEDLDEINGEVSVYGDSLITVVEFVTRGTDAFYNITNFYEQKYGEPQTRKTYNDPDIIRNEYVAWRFKNDLELKISKTEFIGQYYNSAIANAAAEIEKCKITYHTLRLDKQYQKAMQKKKDKEKQDSINRQKELAKKFKNQDI